MRNIKKVLMGGTLFSVWVLLYGLYIAPLAQSLVGSLGSIVVLVVGLAGTYALYAITAQKLKANPVIE